ncbi:MAG: sensor histidine kinase [Ktedonobacteraceae bacterium]
MTKASQQLTPLIIADLHNPCDPVQSEFASLTAPFVDQQTRGLLYLPLWCGKTFGGVLIAQFKTPISMAANVLAILDSCAQHLAMALSNAHLHRTMLHERLRQQEVLDQMPEGIIITEATSGIVQYANPVSAQILNIPLTDLVGAPYYLPLHTLRQAFGQQTDQQHPLFLWTFAVSRALSGKTLHRVETVVIRPDGTYLPVLCSSAPLRTAQGILTGAVLILQDITLQKQLEYERNTFLTLASHELRTPLTAVLGYADLLTEIASMPPSNQIDPELLGIAAQNISSQAEQMAFLIEEMLDLSSLDCDQLTLHLALTDLVDLLKRVQATQARSTEKHHIQLLLDEKIQAYDCTVRIDALRIMQVLNNIVNNAIKYSPEGGNIELGMRLEGQPPLQICLWVKDHGLGISPDALPHLFERFYRSPKLDDSLSGLGIGLYLVKQIIMRHGGQIWVESIEGEGSLFSILLPWKE